MTVPRNDERGAERLRRSHGSDDLRRALLNLIEDARASDARRGRTRDDDPSLPAVPHAAVINDAPLPVVLYDEDGQVVQMSRAWTSLTGLTMDDLPNLRPWLLGCGQSPTAIDRAMAEVFARPEETVHLELEAIGRRGQHQRLVLSSSTSRREGDEPPYAMGMVFDITEHVEAGESARSRQAELRLTQRELERAVSRQTAELAAANALLESELRERRSANAQILSLFRRIVGVQEDERRTLSREIHDELGQHVTALRFRIEALAGLVDDSADVRDALAEVRNLAERVDRALDRVVSELRLPSLEHVSLEITLRELTTTLSEQLALPITYECRIGSTLDLPVTTHAHMFRIVQEALHNVHKHADATTAIVELAADEQEVTVRVIDDGCGFDRPSGPRQGLGLVGMRERAAIIGATLDIDARPGKGTTILLRLPLSPPPNGTPP